MVFGTRVLKYWVFGPSGSLNPSDPQSSWPEGLKDPTLQYAGLPCFEGRPEALMFFFLVAGGMSQFVLREFNKPPKEELHLF